MHQLARSQTGLTSRNAGEQVLCPEFASNTLFLGGDVGEDAFLSLHNNPSLANSQQACSLPWPRYAHALASATNPALFIGRTMFWSVRMAELMPHALWYGRSSEACAWAAGRQARQRSPGAA